MPGGLHVVRGVAAARRMNPTQSLIYGRVSRSECRLRRAVVPSRVVTRHRVLDARTLSHDGPNMQILMSVG